MTVTQFKPKVLVCSYAARCYLFIVCAFVSIHTISIILKRTNHAGSLNIKIFHCTFDLSSHYNFNICLIDAIINTEALVVVSTYGFFCTVVDILNLNCLTLSQSSSSTLLPYSCLGLNAFLNFLVSKKSLKGLQSFSDLQQGV